MINLGNNTLAKKKILSWSVVSLLMVPILLLGIPTVSASTVNITLNPTTHVAQVVGVSSTKIIFTYPANSLISNGLNGYNYSTSVSGYLPSTASSTDDFENVLRNYTSTISVQNISASLETRAVANSTALIITRNTNLTAWVTGIYNDTNGQLIANLEWKAFTIRGSFIVPMDGHNIDLNMMGSGTMESLGDNSIASAFLSHSFGGDNIWSRPTIDFAALSTPLTNWTRHYDASTNTTTFSKSVNSVANYSASVSVNGQGYSISMASDPSSTVKVLGYATASGNSLIISTSPPNTFSFELAAIVALTLVVILGTTYVIVRQRNKIRPTSSVPSVA